MRKKTDLSVALLFEDIKDAQKVSAIFKKIGVHPYFYDNLRDFWNGLLEDSPSLAIIDVKKMTEKGLLLKNHSLIVEEKIPLAFFFSNDSKPLLLSTYELFHLGLLDDSKPLQGQVKNLLKRVNKFNSVLKEGKFFQEKCSTLDSKISTVIESLQDYRENEFFQKRLKEIIESFEAKKNGDSFDEVFAAVISEWKDIEAFTIFELNGSGQRLLSPELESKKYKKVPSIWLGSACAKGIDTQAQSLASQVVYDLIGGDLMVLNIASKLIFLQLNNEEMLNSFDWNALEIFLVGVDSQISGRTVKEKSGEKLFVNSWELLSDLDAQFYSSNSLEEINEEVLIDISLAPLVSEIRSNSQNRFFWKRFFRDFSYKISSSINNSFKMSLVSAEHLALLVDKDDANQIFSKLKLIASRFSYWRYFENNDALLTKEIKPLVRMIPLSSDAYLNYLEKGQVQLVSNPIVSDKIQLEEMDFLAPLAEIEAPLEIR